VLRIERDMETQGADMQGHQTKILGVMKLPDAWAENTLEHQSLWFNAPVFSFLSRVGKPPGSK